MRYKINLAQTVNQLTPHYIGGRKLILFMQSILQPLQSVNDKFSNWANETRVDASMTSQVIMFEWYLNRKFQKYFSDPAGRIVISDGERVGLPIYHEGADIPETENVLLYNQSEANSSAPLFYKNENLAPYGVSFIVHTPKVNQLAISDPEYLSLLRYVIDKYRFSGKTYKIKFNS